MTWYGDFTNDHGLMTRFRMDTRFEKDNQGSVRPFLNQRRLLRTIGAEIQSHTRMAIIRRIGISLDEFERASSSIPYTLGNDDLENAIDILDRMGFDPMIRYLLTTRQGSHDAESEE